MFAYPYSKNRRIIHADGRIELDPDLAIDRQRRVVGKRLIGTLTITEPTKATIPSEYAAWWTEVMLTPGTYELTESDYSTGYVSATIPAVITHEENAPHYGGVAFGPSTQRRTGQIIDYHWSVYTFTVARMILEGTTASFTIDLYPDIEAVWIEFERRSPCSEVMGFSYRQDANGEYIRLHQHALDANDNRLSYTERQAASDATYVCDTAAYIASRSTALYARDQRRWTCHVAGCYGVEGHDSFGPEDGWHISISNTSFRED